MLDLRDSASTGMASQLLGGDLHEGTHIDLLVRNLDQIGGNIRLAVFLNACAEVFIDLLHPTPVSLAVLPALVVVGAVVLLAILCARMFTKACPLTHRMVHIVAHESTVLVSGLATLTSTAAPTAATVRAPAPTSTLIAARWLHPWIVWIVSTSTVSTSTLLSWRRHPWVLSFVIVAVHLSLRQRSTTQTPFTVLQHVVLHVCSLVLAIIILGNDCMRVARLPAIIPHFPRHSHPFFTHPFTITCPKAFLSSCACDRRDESNTENSHGHHWKTC